MRSGKYESISDIGPTKDELAQHRWPLEIGALWLQGFLLRLCLFWWVIDRRENDDREPWEGARVAWVLGWLFVLIVIWAINPSGILKEVFAGLAVLRLIELFTTGLGTVLNRQQQARARSLITIGIYGIQIALIFAILEHAWAGHAFFDGRAYATRPLDFLYISWTAMTTIGNNIYTPQGDTARVLQMLNTTSGLLLLGVLLAFGINHIPKELQDEKPSKKPKAPKVGQV
jgi:hypothetical protein